MEKLSNSLKQNASLFDNKINSNDLIKYQSTTTGGTDFLIYYIDSLIDKTVLGRLVIDKLLPLTNIESEEDFKRPLSSPELEELTTFEDCINKLLNANAILIVDGFKKAYSIGATFFQTRSIAEPPNEINVKGPRECFIENININQSLMRRRIKNVNLVFKNLSIGKQSQTQISICYIQGIVNEKVLKSVEEKIKKINIDNIPDSSYIAKYLANRPFSIFKQVGTTEKPDVLADKIMEGRVGIIVDGSPIALSVPFLLVEDLQTAEDHFVSPFKASFVRFLRVFALIIAILLPAYYVSAQLFKIDLVPLNLLLSIASGVKGLPLSPSLEMFFVLLIFEIINEASIRMPKYVGQALSIVGALVLGETAVRAGIISIPSIIIIALSGLCLYTVPEQIETTSLLRLIFLIVAGSFGPYGMVVLTALLLIYLSTTDNFGIPLTAPFSPLIKHDLKDSVYRKSIFSLTTRPKIIGSKNRTRLKKER